MAPRNNRAGRISSVHRPAMNGIRNPQVRSPLPTTIQNQDLVSHQDGFGTTERNPPGRASRMMITMACRKRVKMSRILRMVPNGRTSRIQGACGIRHPHVQGINIGCYIRCFRVMSLGCLLRDSPVRTTIAISLHYIFVSVFCDAGHLVTLCETYL
jgi:hypothetical protein